MPKYESQTSINAKLVINFEARPKEANPKQEKQREPDYHCILEAIHVTTKKEAFPGLLATKELLVKIVMKAASSSFSKKFNYYSSSNV